MSRRICILMRHGDYHQRSETPSAHQPYPLNDVGTRQANEGVARVRRMVDDNGWTLHPVVHCSMLLRAWQTACILRDGIVDCTTLCEDARLAERGLGSAANLNRSEIESIVADDPRYENLPTDWKLDSHFRLPFIGAESLMEAGQRVADYIRHETESLSSDRNDIAILFVGHGGSFRHAAYHLGTLPFDDVAKLSMYHARPVALALEQDGRWTQVAGDWKVRSNHVDGLD